MITMMIDVKLLIYIVLASFTIIGGIVGFFVMQNNQNRDIKDVSKKQEELDKKQSSQSKYQIETEKNIIEINGKMKNMDDKMDMVLTMMKELKDRGCGRCSDRT
jgi:peptidoglycan hydrolase CwlO-like protein